VQEQQMTHCISVMLLNASCQLRTGLRVTRTSSPKLEAIMFLSQPTGVLLSGLLIYSDARALMCA